MELKNLIYEVKDEIGYLTLNRPKKLNALSPELMEEFRAALDRIETDPKVRVVILTGAGRAFSAGFDIGAKEGEPEIYERPADQWRSNLRQDIDTFLKIWRSEKPYIAAINGYALAGACELAQICDIKIASERAVLGEPEIRFGNGPPLLITPFSVGFAKAKELLLTGETLTAQEAERLGMINRVVPHEQLMAECEKTARKLINIAKVGVTYNKAAINRAFENMGFLNTIYQNLELVTLYDTTRTEEQETFNRIREEKGLKAALAWRDSRFREEE
ncbi:MAG: enoyl-CoA hydratase/isomerase family protein [Deltaproteobacteria bacterium]|nr:enoyl-CoA hydratase/isomerase family protein [Deltaproteobacteria bacterium]